MGMGMGMGMVTYQANPKLLGLGGGATQGDEGMGRRENIIECMYKEPLVILFHVCLMMFWTLNMVLFLAFDMELHFLAIQLGLLCPLSLTLQYISL
jgi:hypothetical protein